MTLEEKISALPPQYRTQVEDYIDFLLSRIDDQDINPEFPISSGGGASIESEHKNASLVNPRFQDQTEQVRKKAESSGIILAEECAPENSNPDYVDFADINSRFGHTLKGEEEQKGPGRLRRLLDWM